MRFPIINNIISDLPKESYRNGAGAYEGVVAHSTASYAPDENQVKYFINNWKKRKAFVQYFVDWDSIRQTSDINFRAWGAGPTANQRYVHVELCQTKERALFLESYKRYVWLLAWILRRRNLGVIDGKTLLSHDYCSRTFKDTTHTDPIGYLKEHDVSWVKLVADVKAEYDKLDIDGNYKVTSTPQPHYKKEDTCGVQLNGTLLPVTGILQNGVSFIPIRAVAEAVGGTVDYSKTTGQIKVDGRIVPSRIINGKGYGSTRELASILSMKVEWNNECKMVILKKLPSPKTELDD